MIPSPRTGAWSRSSTLPAKLSIVAPFTSRTTPATLQASTAARPRLRPDESGTSLDASGGVVIVVVRMGVGMHVVGFRFGHQLEALFGHDAQGASTGLLGER